MPDFSVEPHASLTLGNTCTFCSTHKHDRGFVNLLVDILGRGRIYACAGCADQIGRAVGGLDPRQAAELRDVVEDAHAQVQKAADELETAKENMVVPLAEVIDFLEERAKRRPAEKAPAKAKA